MKLIKIDKNEIGLFYEMIEQNKEEFKKSNNFECYDMCVKIQAQINIRE